MADVSLVGAMATMWRSRWRSRHCRPPFDDRRPGVGLPGGRALAVGIATGDAHDDPRRSRCRVKYLILDSRSSRTATYRAETLADRGQPPTTPTASR
ncbi:MAG: hypothetical protein QG671_1770 [Actinomycetota bacterium]|nr:hypothetical protein [Actinomycetota bacterium]